MEKTKKALKYKCSSRCLSRSHNIRHYKSKSESFNSNSETNISSSNNTKRKKKRRVKFNEKVIVLSVESYKKFNIDVAKAKGCQAWEESRKKILKEQYKKSNYDCDCTCVIY